MKMYWKSLADNKCPKCGSPIMLDPKRDGLCCSTSGMISLGDCDFFITQQRFLELVEKIKSGADFRDITMKDNLSDLNNLGREEVVDESNN